MSKEQKINLLVLIIVVGFCVAVTYHHLMGLWGALWPANTFLFRPWDRFSDFTEIVRQSATLNPYPESEHIYGFAGTPFGQFVGYLFSVIRPASLRLPIFLGSFFIAFILMVKHCLYGLRSRPTLRQFVVLFAVVFLTYPVLFAADRANFDLLVLPLLSLFAFTYGKQQYKASTVFLGLAIAIKPYTAILLMVYIFDKRHRETALAVFNVALLSVFSLALFKGGLFAETHKYLTALWHHASDSSFGSELIYTSDLFSGLTVAAKSVGNMLNLHIYLPEHPNVRLAYAILAAVAALYSLLHLWQQPKSLWRTLAVLTILIILLPFTTHDYRLIYLFVPMLMYLASNENTRHDLLIVILWGLLLIPKNYYRLESPQNIGMIINPLLLIGLLICIVPDAFTKSGLTSALRFAYERLRSVGRFRKLENARSS